MAVSHDPDQEAGVRAYSPRAAIRCGTRTEIACHSRSSLTLSSWCATRLRADRMQPTHAPVPGSRGQSRVSLWIHAQVASTKSAVPVRQGRTATFHSAH